ncbi:MAG TPA: glycosyltransferase family 4 protein [Planctomycetia bacterium]|nr:glycosyltransferase family 4 protein [Planctomycetia bacterium]
MRILYISQYYPPEMGAPAARVSELAREWTAQGHEVTVLTAFPHHPHGVKRPEDRYVLTRKERDGAVKVVRTYVYAARNAGFLKRTLGYLSFAFSAIFIGMWRVGRPDVVIATSPQLFTGIAGRALAFLKRAPFLFEVRDLWPESIVTVGAMNEGFMIRRLKGLASWLYRTCDRIVTVGEGYKRRIVQYYPIQASKIDVVTNGVDLDLFRFRSEDRRRVRERQGWNDETKVALYLGTHGMAHGLDFVLEAAAQLPGRRFVFVGDGADKPKLREIAKSKGLVNVEFLPPMPKSEVVGLYAAADVCLVPLRKVDLFTDVLPSKIFEIMGMRRPMVISVDGDARQCVEAAEAGLFAEPENVGALCSSIEQILADPALAERMGRSGRRYVERNFDRRVLAQQYLYLLAAAAGSVATVEPAPEVTRLSA